MREYRAEQKQCPHCQHITIAAFPAGVQAPIHYGPHVGATAVYLVEQQLLPLARACEVMSDLLGVHMSEGTVCDLIQRCAGQLAPVEQQITEALKQAEVIHQDETGLYVAGKRHWMHVTCTPTLTHYHVDKSRGQAALEAIGILPYFTGISIHDGWASYFLYDCQHAACLVHVLRDLVFLAEEQGAVWAADLKELLLDMKQATDQAREQGKLWLDPLEVVDWEHASWNCSMKEIGFILMPWRLLEHEGDANKAPPAICLIGCANTSRQSGLPGGSSGGF